MPPGNARAKECLELHRADANFSTDCRTELEDMMEARSADFRLDPQLKKHCTKDIESLCYTAYEEVRELPDDDAQVITCLQDFRCAVQTPGLRQVSFHVVQTVKWSEAWLVVIGKQCVVAQGWPVYATLLALFHQICCW